MTFVHPKSLQNDLKRLQNAYSKSSFHASNVLSILHDHFCKMLIAAPPGIGFFAYDARTSLKISAFGTTFVYHRDKKLYGDALDLQQLPFHS